MAAHALALARDRLDMVEEADHLGVEADFFPSSAGDDPAVIARSALEAARRIGNSHAEMFALQSTGLCLTAAGRHNETVEIQAEALEHARRLKARLPIPIWRRPVVWAIAVGDPAKAPSRTRHAEWAY